MKKISTTGISTTGITRRSMLKTTAAAALIGVSAVAALGAPALADNVKITVVGVGDIYAFEGGKDRGVSADVDCNVHVRAIDVANITGVIGRCVAHQDCHAFGREPWRHAERLRGEVGRPKLGGVGSRKLEFGLQGPCLFERSGRVMDDDRQAPRVQRTDDGRAATT